MSYAPDNIKDKLTALITESYEPAGIPGAGTTCMTTTELFDKLQLIYPSEEYTALYIAVWLEELGFKTCNMGNMRFEWILKKK